MKHIILTVLLLTPFVGPASGQAQQTRKPGRADEDRALAKAINAPVEKDPRVQSDGNRLDLKANDFHWKDAAKIIQGNAVADCVLKLLPARRQATLPGDFTARP